MRIWYVWNNCARYAPFAKDARLIIAPTRGKAKSLYYSEYKNKLGNYCSVRAKLFRRVELH